MATRREIMAAGGALLSAATVNKIARAQQVAAPTSPADVPGTPSSTIMTKEYVDMVGRIAYVWGWPMVNQINRRASFAKAPEPGRLGGPPNRTGRPRRYAHRLHRTGPDFRYLSEPRHGLRRWFYVSG